MLLGTISMVFSDAAVMFGARAPSSARTRFLQPFYDFLSMVLRAYLWLDESSM